MYKKPILAALVAAIILLIVCATPAGAAPTAQGSRVAYASGALYSGPYGRGTYRGWTYGQRVVQFGTGGWYCTAAGWVHGTVTYQWSGYWNDRVTAGVSYWGTYGQAPAAWW